MKGGDLGSMHVRSPPAPTTAQIYMNKMFYLPEYS